MATAEAVEQQQVRRERTGGRFLRFLGRSPVHILLVVLGLLWLVPTIGLFLTSLLSAEDYLEGGWWQVLSEPSKFTFENYSAIFDNETITSSLVTTIWIAIGGTLLPILVGALAGYAFAWLEFPGRDWLFVVVIALLVVPLQMALIPMFRLYETFGINDTVFALILFHTGLRPAVRHLPPAQLLHRDPERPARGRPDRRRLGDQDLRPADPAAGPARHRLARHLPVPLDVERPARRAGLRPRDAADHGGDLPPAGAVRRQHRDHRAGHLRLAGDPAHRLLRLPALLCPGPAGGLRQIAMSRVCAIVGGGLAGFVAYATLRKGGSSRPKSPCSEPTRIRPPPGAFARRQFASGGCAPRATAIARRPRFPGLAVRAALRRRSFVPLAESVCDRFHPTVEEFLEHVEDLRAKTSWDESFQLARIARVGPWRAGSSWTSTASFRTSSSPRVIRASPSRRSSSAIRAPFTRTSRTTTQTRSRWSARAWPPRRSG